MHTHTDFSLIKFSWLEMYEWINSVGHFFYGFVKCELYINEIGQFFCLYWPYINVACQSDYFPIWFFLNVTLFYFLADLCLYFSFKCIACICAITHRIHNYNSLNKNWTIRISITIAFLSAMRRTYT